jgi:hypothetical protein
MRSRSGAQLSAELAAVGTAWASAGVALAMLAAASCEDCRHVAERPRDLVLFAGWLGTVYAAAFAVVGLGAFLLSRLLGVRSEHGDGASLWSRLGAHAVGAAIAAALVCIFQDLAVTTTPSGGVRGRGLFLILAALPLAAALVIPVAHLLLGFLRQRGRWSAALALVFPAVSLGVLITALPSIGREAPISETVEAPAAAGRGPVLLFAVDGADWRRIDPLLARGRLPNLATIIARGVRAPLATTRPTYSPILWTTIATGAAEPRHGVYGFTELRFPGLPCGVQRLPRRVLLRELVVLGTWFDLFETPLSACRVRSKPLWAILSEHSRRVAIVRWWATWPAAPVAGYLVSDRSPRRVALEIRDQGLPLAESSRITYPPDLLDHIDADPRDLDPATLLEEPLFQDLDPAERDAIRGDQRLMRLLGQIYANDRFSAEIGLVLLERGPLDLVALYLSGIDNFSHRMGRYPATVDRYYEVVDGVLGRYLAALPADATVMVVSDHGWDYDPKRAWGHLGGPAGILAAAGPPIVAGAAISPSATIFDVAPTVLGLFGLPATEEMPGRVIREMLTDDARRAAPTARISSYGRPAPSPPPEEAEQRGREWDQETLRRMRALGYLR